jgi:hypothetical protein
MDGKYSSRMNLDPISNYNIRVVAETFTKLVINT